MAPILPKARGRWVTGSLAGTRRPSRHRLPRTHRIDRCWIQRDSAGKAAAGSPARGKRGGGEDLAGDASPRRCRRWLQDTAVLSPRRDGPHPITASRLSPAWGARGGGRGAKLEPRQGRQHRLPRHDSCRRPRRFTRGHQLRFPTRGYREGFIDGRSNPEPMDRGTPRCTAAEPGRPHGADSRGLLWLTQQRRRAWQRHSRRPQHVGPARAAAAQQAARPGGDGALVPLTGSGKRREDAPAVTPSEMSLPTARSR